MNNKTNRPNYYDVIIIGAGASGLMSALRASERGLSVLILEKTSKIGSKISISGGGRCNFSNLNVSDKAYICPNKHFTKSALARYNTQNFINLLKKHGLSYTEKTAGQLFCDQNANALVEMFGKELHQHKIRVEFEQIINLLEKTETGNFLIQTNTPFSVNKFEAKSLIIATGGASMPLIGATDFCLQVAKKFKIKNTPFAPALVSLTVESQFAKKFNSILSGISHEVSVRFEKIMFTDQLLITHHGFSGPAILQISSYWHKNSPIYINWCPKEFDENEAWLIKYKRKYPQITLSKILTQLIKNPMPKRLGEHLVKIFFGDKIISDFTDKMLREISISLQNFKIIPTGTSGMNKAEVCRGGILPSEVSSKTFECKSIKNLYFVGEALDVIGWLGGYNLQWAWSSGWCAGDNIEK